MKLMKSYYFYKDGDQDDDGFPNIRDQDSDDDGIKDGIEVYVRLEHLF